jgi:Replicative DNA helicase
MMTENLEWSLDRQIVGLALSGPRNLADVRTVRAEWFDDPLAAEVWGVIQRLDREGTPVDPQIVFGRASEINELHRSHLTLVWLFDCVQAAPNGFVGEHYAAQLKDRYWRRVLAGTLTRSLQLLDGSGDIRQVRLEVMATLDKLDLQASSEQSFDDVLEEAMSSFNQITPYVPTPWDGLNDVIRGWRPGGLYVVGARPGVGKSLVLMQAAMGITSRGPVLFESLEMSPSEVMTRIIANESGVALNRLKGRREDGTGGPSAEDWRRLREVAKGMRGTPLHIRGKGVRTPLDVREHARDVKAKGGLAGIVVDYLQIMSGSSRRQDSRASEIAEYTRQLKLMAMEFECPVIIASQLNRESVKEGKAPTLSALRESGSIEQDADVVLLLNTNEADATWDPNGDVPIKAMVAKNRQGPIAKFELIRSGKNAKIYDNYMAGN